MTLNKIINRGSILVIFVLLFSCSSKKNNIEFYISPGGNDNNPGTESSPFKSLAKARDAVRMIKKENQDKPVVVYIKGGDYFLENSVTFTAEDSGSGNAPVIYKAWEGEQPVFTGSVEVKDWRLLADPTKLALLNSTIEGKIYYADLNTYGIKDFGDPTDIGKRPELFCNGEVQTLARWPNEGFTHAGKVKGKTELPPTYINVRGTKEGDFEYLDERLDRWAKEEDVRLGGYWYWDWSDEFQKVDKIDTKNNIIRLSKPYHRYGYKDSLRYFGLNLFCEIDEPGEWYIDRSEGIIYWYPPKGTNPAGATVSLSVFNAPFMIEMENCSHLTIQGLTFREGRGSAVSVKKGKNCLVKDCKIERFGKDGIHINGGSGHGISGCLIHTLGCRGINLIGGDRRNLIPSDHFVENTVVEYFSLFKRTYEPAVYLSGCGSKVNNNRFRYSSSSALRISGNDFVIEYNEISHVVSESDDQGGVDTWANPSYQGNVIRYNRWSYISGGTLHGAAAIRLDDMISGFHIYGNIFEWCGSKRFGGVQIHGGKDNIVENNFFYKCYAAVSFTTWGERWLKQLDSPEIQKRLYKQVDINSPLYQNRYPQLKNIRGNVDVNTVKNNLLVDCKKRFLRDNGKQILENNFPVRAEGKTLQEICIPELFQEYGMQPIPVQKIGPKNNKWLNEK